MKALTIALAWILIIQQTHYCLGVPRHRRRSNSLFVTEKVGAGGVQCAHAIAAKRFALADIALPVSPKVSPLLTDRIAQQPASN